MQAPKRRSYVIDLNGPRARINLKLLALSYPIWGVLLPLKIASIGSNVTMALTALQRFEIAAIYLIPTTIALVIFSNRLVIKHDRISQGYRFFGGNDTNKLTSLEIKKSALNNEDNLLVLKFAKGHGQKISVDTTGMDSNMKSRLMAAIDNLAPSCQSPLAVRALLTQGQSRLIKSSLNGDAGNNLAFKYDAQRGLTKVRESLSQYQFIFWRAWTGVLIPLTIYILPLLIYMCIRGSDGPDLKDPSFDIEFHPFLQSWARAWDWAAPLAWAIQNIRMSVSLSAHHPGTAVLITVIGLMAAGYAARIAFKPNWLIANEEGVRLSLCLFGLKIKMASISWPEIVVIKLANKTQPDPDKWTIVFTAGDGNGKLKLNLGAIVSKQNKIDLLRAFEHYAPGAAIDGDLVNLLTPSLENSYTDLWITSLAAAPQREKLTPLKAGQSLSDGRYVIDSRIGSGGQGLAYLAKKTDLEAEEKEAMVVLKEIILPVYTNAESSKNAILSFNQDALILHKLDHHGIVKLEDYFIEDHRAYLVLQRIEGLNLRQWVDANGKADPILATDWARQMCDILSYLHERQPAVLHRDFTPENIMVDKRGYLKLIDFDVAQEVKSHATSTVVGKHAFLPPEQIRGLVTAQSDLYALGATLYFALVGTDPEPISQLDLIGNLNNSESNSGKAAKLLAQAVYAATALQPEDRMESAAAFKKLLDG